MPSLYDRLIIGAGTTAAVYLSFFPQRSGEKVGVIGLPEPWAGRGRHRMGQPAHLLMLPIDTPDRPDGFDPHTEQTGVPDRNGPPNRPFLRSDVYSQQMRDLPQHNELRDDAKYRTAWVKRITWLGGRFKVSYQYQDNRQRKFLHARNVVVATGPGVPNDRELPLAPEDDYFYIGDRFLNEDKTIRGPCIAVEGGSATAAWCVEKALMAGAERVYWFVRTGNGILHERFGGAFPAGDRNEWLRRNRKILQFFGTFQSARIEHNSIQIHFEDQGSIVVDQYIFAIGASETADYLGDLRNELEPIRDTQRHLHTDNDCILAYENAAQNLLVIGAGVFKLRRSRRGETDAYAKGNEYLPTAARPPEGIPTIIATIATLTRYLGGSRSRWLDINLANFSDLDNHFRQGIARYFSTLACARLGLPWDQYGESMARFITDQVIGTRIMKTSPYGIKVEEIAELYNNFRTMEPPELRVMYDAWL